MADSPHSTHQLAADWKRYLDDGLSGTTERPRAVMPRDLIDLLEQLQAAQDSEVGWGYAAKVIEDENIRLKEQVQSLELACDHHRMFWQKAEERERGLKEQLEAVTRVAEAAKTYRDVRGDYTWIQMIQALDAWEHSNPANERQVPDRILGVDLTGSNPASGEDGRRPFASDLPDSPGKSGEAESTEMSMSVSPESSPASVPHGRDCPCTPCKAEDWDSVEAGIRGWIEDKQMRRNP